MATAQVRFFSLGRIVAWGLFALALLLAPKIFTSGRSLSMFTQMGYLIIICLSYNMQMGQGGLLSFCHAVFTGTGGFAVAHLINAMGADGGIPLVVVPIFGGVTAALLALPLGYISTRKAGVTFAMISLGVGEMIVAIAVMLPGFFGGDSGISLDRVYGKPFMGLTFGPQIQVYYLIAAYCFICTALMYAFTQTPLGRMLNAVRDNPERAGFVGYDTHRVRLISFVLSCFFAGVGGALVAINYEIVNAVDALGTITSGSYLLFTFLGGVTVFYGPIIGAVLMVLAFVLLSDLTSAWLLYLGLVFLLMVMFVPGGVGSLIAANARLIRFGKFSRFYGHYTLLTITALVALAGIAALIELVYNLQLNLGDGAEVSFLGLTLNSGHAGAWIGALAVAVVGLLAAAWAYRRWEAAWGDAQQEIEAQISGQELRA